MLEELLMADVHMHPFEVLGWEGIIGTIFMLVTLAVATVVPGDVASHFRVPHRQAYALLVSVPRT